MQLFKNRFDALLTEYMTPKEPGRWGTKNQPANTTNLTSQAVDLILSESVRLKASDIHLEPFQTHLRVRLRIDGKLYDVLRIDLTHDIAVIPRIKVMSNLMADAASSRKAMDGRFSSPINGKQFDFRVATFPTILGEKLVLRVLNKEQASINLARIGLAANDSMRVEQMLQHKSGLIIVSGPTGGGKTTTLYSLINRLHSPFVNITTLEDPVEYQIDGINQCAINAKIGDDFAAGLRAVLRQDPNVILIGEIRDKETADIALRASITGHLVMTSIHSNSALGTIIRLINMGLEKYMVSYAMVGAIAQRLVPKLCEKCRSPYHTNMATIKQICRIAGVESKVLLPDQNVNLAEDSPEDNQFVNEVTFYKRNGCNTCNNTGYTGRIGIFEVIYFTPELREAILHDASTREMKKIAMRSNNGNMSIDALEKFKTGAVALEDIIPILIESSSS